MIVSGALVASAGSVDTRVSSSPEMVRKGYVVVGDIVYVRAPQSVNPSKLPKVVLAVSVASTVCVSDA